MMLNTLTGKIVGLSLLSLLIIFSSTATESQPETEFFELNVNHTVEDNQVIFDFELINNHESEQVLQFGSGQQYEIIIINDKQEEVYRYSDGKFFTLALVYKDLKPGEGLKWQEVWTPTDNGIYTVQISILTRLANSEQEIPSEQLTKSFDIELQASDAKSIIKTISDETILAIKNKDSEKWAQLVHPIKGVRFTPYTYVSVERDVVFVQEDIRNFFNDQNQYLWGYYDGTGWDILLTPTEYYERFIYSHDFINAEQVGYNEVLSHGNMLENQFEVYDNPIIVEYYFPGFNLEYGGLDWRSLRLVFEEYNNTWKLVGVISNQWTI